jgi:hypothetical protein
MLALHFCDGMHVLIQVPHTCAVMMRRAQQRVGRGLTEQHDCEGACQISQRMLTYVVAKYTVSALW